MYSERIRLPALLDKVMSASDAAALIEDGRFEHLARALYGPLLEWMDSHVEAVPHPAPETQESAR